MLPKRLRYALETVGAYALYGILRLLPLEASSGFCGRVLRLWGPEMGVSRTARANLESAFPEKSADEREDILRGMWENLGRVIGEYPHLRRIWRNVELVGGEHFDAVRESGRAAIFLSGHLANWEIAAIGAKNKGVPASVVYRRPNNTGVDGLLRHARNAGAAGHIVKGRQGAREIVSLLKKGGAVGIMIDQRLSEGIPVPFFGRDAMTPPAAAHFALRLGCQLYPTRVERLGGARFRMTIYPAMDLRPTGDNDADALRIMTEMNAMLEGWVRERPEQWLWIHKRWAV